jgi:nitroreductase
MLETTQRTATWCNVQPWRVYLTRPAATERLAAALTEYARENERRPDFEMPAGYRDEHLQRRRVSGSALYNVLGVRRDDYEARTREAMRNYSFFGAPHTVIITSPRYLGFYGGLDCGLFVSTLLLVAQSHGLATIAQAAIAQHPECVRETLGISDEEAVVCAVSLGYADTDHPVNSFRTDRAPLSEILRVIDR